MSKLKYFLIAGFLLLSSGFLTDSVGLLLLIPAVRRVLFNRLAPRLIASSAGCSSKSSRLTPSTYAMTRK